MTNPNIIFVTCDQLRAFDVGCYGNPTVRTPNIDRLAARGVRFETAITPNPVCTPARSCWLSGQYTRTCAGMLGNVHEDPPNARRERLLDPTLPETLQAAGYRTALIGKWHVDPRPELIGFDTALYPKIAHRHYGQTVFNEKAESQVVNEFLEDFFAAHVDQLFSEQEDSDTPFFLNYNISTPHQPIGPGHLPERYVNMYSPDDIELRPNTGIEGPHDPEFWYRVYRSADYFWDWHYGREFKPEDQKLPEGFGLRDLTALYYGAIACVDDYVGRLMNALEDHGLADNTLVVFTSDHGDNLGSHGLFNKNSLIEEAIRVPLIVADLRRGEDGEDREGGDIASLIDIAPTLLDTAGIMPPEHMQGRALFREGGADAAFVETGRMLGVRTQTHLYGLSYDAKSREISDGETWLYDLRTDPYEMRNLADTGEQPETKAELHQRLTEWARQTPWMKQP